MRRPGTRPRRGTGLVILTALVLSLCAGCPWPRTHPDDQQRCDPACETGQTCKQGSCVPTGTSDAGPDLVVADGPPGCTSRPPMPVLQLPGSTNHLKVALRGTAKGAQKVTVTGWDKPQTVVVTKDAFCAVLTLQAVATPQTFKVVSLDSAGCKSPAATATITYNKSIKIVNVLYKIQGTSKQPPVKGTLAALTDGKADGVVTLSAPTSQQYCGKTDYNYLWFDLGSVRTVDEVDIRYPKHPPTADYISCWMLLGSSQANPVPPTAAIPPGWTKLYDISSEKGRSPVAVDIFDTKTRHLAIVLLEDDDMAGVTEYFELTEIEAWGLPVEPTCK